MKKIIALIMAGIVVMVAYTNPIYAIENEAIEVTAVKEVQTLGVTPKLSIPKLPKVPNIKPKFNLNIDFGKYIPHIY